MRGVTLVELAVVLVLVALLTAILLPATWRWSDRMAVERAVWDIAVFYHAARQSAVLRGRDTRIEFGTDSLRAVQAGGPDSVVLSRPGPGRHGVVLTASRPTITLEAGGVGLGGANTKLVVRRGGAADSLTTSRLGRLKRW